MTTPAKYRRIAELGRGGMAIVHLTAMRSSHGVIKLVVVKELQPNLVVDPEFRAMFLDEARLAARLNHPNVIQTFEIVDHHDDPNADDGLAGSCGIVMEYLDGQPMNRLRNRLFTKPGSLNAALAILIEALSGLEYAHTLVDYQGRPLGIVHRDMSPHNVFITYSGEVKVLDFGIAKANDASSRPTQVGVVKGKLAYMAPEQAAATGVDARADVFAVGVMLWEAVTGRRLWQRMNDAAIMYKLMSGDIPPPSEIVPDVSPVLDAICRKALAIDPSQRYESARALREDLERFSDSLGARPTRRMLGDVVAQLFIEERSQVRRVVETQLGQAKAAATDQFTSIAPTLPQIPLPKDSTSEVEKGSGASGLIAGVASRSAAPEPKRRAGAMWMLVATCVLLGVSGSLVAMFHPWGTPTPATSAPAQETSAITHANTLQPTSATKTIVTQPVSARILVNGRVLTSTPARVDVTDPIDVHVEADGYQSTDVRVTRDAPDPITVLLPKVATSTVPKPPVTSHLLPTTAPTTRPTSTVTAIPTATANPTDVGY